ncbi:hypothetical protein SAMN05216223_13361 [Actinacidiphila yanglinensis]|uniref:Uncharacterized protein n=1 Tax=Actinacidiphila yanglinensis TaxID=310779 RepID=A0A1H6EC80_9ACTN|nr:DUF6461 domain-containing protein [Actinacidiphila yanglinensis]SEG95448.1 hypothetical protein SAMN05216223_13361 [Actinacidiphila yanglinensis]
MTSVTARDYAWIRSSPLFRQALDCGYSMALVRGVPPEEVLRVMDAEPQGTCEGVAEWIERQDELCDALDFSDDSFLAGAFTVPGEDGDWTLVWELARGGTGIRPRFLEALSAGGRAVQHSSNGGKPIDGFSWYEDGELRTTFEAPPTYRSGSTPDALLPLMGEVGCDLRDVQDRTAGPADDKAAVLALTERLTGVRLTEEVLRDAHYRLGLVPEEPVEEWTSVTVDITDAHGERFHRVFTRTRIEEAASRARAQAAPRIDPIPVRTSSNDPGRA